MTVQKRSPLLNTAAQVDGNGSVNIPGTATTTTIAPAAGGAGALPATPAGYVNVVINGTTRKIAYY